jgi:hypothetical protein
MAPRYLEETSLFDVHRFFAAVAHLVLRRRVAILQIVHLTQLHTSCSNYRRCAWLLKQMDRSLPRELLRGLSSLFCGRERREFAASPSGRVSPRRVRGRSAVLRRRSRWQPTRATCGGGGAHRRAVLCHHHSCFYYLFFHGSQTTVVAASNFKIYWFIDT